MDPGPCPPTPRLDAELAKAADHGWVTIDDVESAMRFIAKEVKTMQDLTHVVAGTLMVARFALATPERAFEVVRRGCFGHVIASCNRLADHPVATMPVLELLLEFLQKMRHHKELRAMVLKFQNATELKTMDETLDKVITKIEQRTLGDLKVLERQVKKEIAPPEAERAEPLRMDCCHQCRRTDKALRTCSRCKAAVYCSVECQKMHFKFHRLHCVPKAAAPAQATVEEKENAEPKVGGFVKFNGVPQAAAAAQATPEPALPKTPAEPKEQTVVAPASKAEAPAARQAEPVELKSEPVAAAPAEAVEFNELD